MKSLLVYVHDQAFESATADKILKEIQRYHVKPHSLFLACQPNIALHYQNALREWLYDPNHYITHHVPLSLLTRQFDRIFFFENGISTLWSQPPVQKAQFTLNGFASAAAF